MMRFQDIIPFILLIVILGVIFFFIWTSYKEELRMKDFCHQRGMEYSTKNIIRFEKENSCLKIVDENIVETNPITMVEGKVRFVKNG